MFGRKNKLNALTTFLLIHSYQQKQPFVSNAWIAWYDKDFLLPLLRQSTYPQHNFQLVDKFYTSIMTVIKALLQ